MIRKRVITVLTVNDGVLFRTRNFIPDYRYTINFVDAWSVDEVVLLDITRPGAGHRENFYEAVTLFSRNCFVPLAVGGGVRNLDEVRTLLNLGADKVIVNSVMAENPAFVTEAARAFGSQCVVVSIDARLNDRDEYEVFTHFGTEPRGVTPDAWAKEAQRLGAGEVLIQSIDRDGMLEGYDNRLNRLVSDAVEVPVLACAGAGKWQDFVDGVKIGGVSAVCTNCIYHFTDASIKSAKQYLKNAGIDVRV